jgi:hypothetical protein
MKGVFMLEFVKNENGTVCVKISKELMKKRPELKLFATALIKAEKENDISPVINLLDECLG